jgi:hypothetical protein
METRMRSGALGVLIALLVSSCTHTPPVGPDIQAVEEQRPEPVIVFWTRYATQLTSATHIVNDVWVGEPDANPDEDPALHQSAWLDRGIIPLDWAGGRVYADQPVEEFSGRWISQIDSGYVGIAIDEFGDADRSVDGRLVEGLVRLRAEHPEAIIAVWHGGPVHRIVAPAYRELVDIVMLERYVRGTRLLGLKFGPMIWTARRFGLAGKAIVAIGIGGERGATTVEEIEAQVRWLRTHAPDLNGIAVYASRGSLELVQAADRIIAEWYLRGVE